MSVMAAIAELQDRVRELEQDKRVVRLVSGGGGDFDWSKLAFGHSVSGNKVTIYHGYFVIYGQGLYEVPGTVVTVVGGDSANPHWITAFLGQDGVGIYNTSLASPPNPQNITKYEVPLALVYLDESNNAQIKTRTHVGSNIIIGNYL